MATAQQPDTVKVHVVERDGHRYLHAADLQLASLAYLDVCSVADTPAVARYLAWLHGDAPAQLPDAVADLDSYRRRRG